MSKSEVPTYDLSFWWLRYGAGLAIPFLFAIAGMSSIVTRHSYTWWRRVGFVPIEGWQAILMGICYSGIGLVIFATCYAQYHEKMGFYYHWLVGLGALFMLGGSFGCSWIFITR